MGKLDGYVRVRPDAILFAKVKLSDVRLRGQDLSRRTLLLPMSAWYSSSYRKWTHGKAIRDLR